MLHVSPLSPERVCAICESGVFNLVTSNNILTWLNLRHPVCTIVLEVTLAKAPSVSLTKMIEATKVNPRTGLPLGVPPVTVPYGGLVEPRDVERDRQRFLYLGELHECKLDLFLSAAGGGGKSESAEAAVEEPAAGPAVEKALEPEVPSGPRLQWDRVNSSNYTVTRAAVPGGWLVTINGSGLTFVPDAKHRWDGASAK